MSRVRVQVKPDAINAVLLTQAAYIRHAYFTDGLEGVKEVLSDLYWEIERQHNSSEPEVVDRESTFSNASALFSGDVTFDELSENAFPLEVVKYYQSKPPLGI